MVLIRCFLKRKQFSVDIALKLGSSFTLAPFTTVVVSILLILFLVQISITSRVHAYIFKCMKLDKDFYQILAESNCWTNVTLVTGNVYHSSNDCYFATCSALLLSLTSHKEGKLNSTFLQIFIMNSF